MKTIISPSILSCDFLNIESEIKHFDNIDDLWFHLDIMDGHFVPNLTFGPPIIKNLHKITSHKLDAHFMVSNPEFYIKAMKDHHIFNFTIHLESVEKNSLKNLIYECKQFYPSVGISIKPNTPVAEIDSDILSLVDLFLVMSVEPGFGGQSFLYNAVDKISILHDLRQKNGYKYIIQVDGGINDETAKHCLSAGADNLVAGSYIFNSSPQDYLDKIKSLRA
ncbi:MAG: ribulose-phosphate 3-epimerase [Halobacteriovoraceae bacterium]|nr:ribulose-phosphate 3-epimerase [Halobacteriovoraceae bacterium]